MSTSFLRTRLNLNIGLQGGKNTSCNEAIGLLESARAPCRTLATWPAGATFRTVVSSRCLILIVFNSNNRSNHKRLHRLAIEDLIQTKTRTKVDWYNDHTYMVLALQKLVNIEEQDDDDDSKPDSGDSETESNEDRRSEFHTRIITERQRRKREQKRRKGAILSLLEDMWKPKEKKQETSYPDIIDRIDPSNSFKVSGMVETPWTQKKIRSMQRYYAGP